MSNKVKVIPIKEALKMQKNAPAKIYKFEKKIGKLANSVYTLCPNCRTWGINHIENKMCGDCNYPYGITYYSAEDVHAIIEKIKK